VLSGEIVPAVPKAVHTASPIATPSLRDFRDRPTHAAEFLALAAVAHYGPTAAANVAWLRNSYPSASAEGIARVAAHRFVRQARTRGAIAGLAGTLAVLLDAGALHALHAELILNIAAAHGKDPTAPERAAELLFLQRVHDSAATASTAVTAAIEPAGAPRDGAGGPTRLGRPLARSLTMGVLRVGARRVLRLIPGAGALIGAVANARATDEVATRALQFYRPGPAGDLGSSGPENRP
jgi:nitroreductase